MADTKTTDETTRSPLDGSEFVRLATSGANWKARVDSFPFSIGTSPILSGTDTCILFDNAGAIGEDTDFTWSTVSGLKNLGESYFGNVASYGHIIFAPGDPVNAADFTITNAFELIVNGYHQFTSNPGATSVVVYTGYKFSGPGNSVFLFDFEPTINSDSTGTIHVFDTFFMGPINYGSGNIIDKFTCLDLEPVQAGSGTVSTIAGAYAAPTHNAGSGSVGFITGYWVKGILRANLGDYVGFYAQRPTTAGGTSISFATGLWIEDHSSLSINPSLNIYSAGTSSINYFEGQLEVVNGSQTASFPALNITQTWNNAAAVFNAITLTVTDTSSNVLSNLLNLAISTKGSFTVTKYSATGLVGLWLLRPGDTQTVSNYNFLNDVSSDGMILNHGNQFQFWINDSHNVCAVSADSGGTAPYALRIHATDALGFSGGAPYAFNCDVQLYRDAADTFAQRRSTNSQTFRVYNTYSAAGVNYERGVFDWTTTPNRLTIGTQAAGTGAGRGMTLSTAGNTDIGIFPGSGTVGFTLGVNSCQISSPFGTGSFIFIDKFACDYSNSDAVIGRASAGRFTYDNNFTGATATVEFGIDGANDILAQRRGTNAQTFRVYNTYTNATTYERAVFGWSSNLLLIGTEVGVAGTPQSLRFVTGGFAGFGIDYNSGTFYGDSRRGAVPATPPSIGAANADVLWITDGQYWGQAQACYSTTPNAGAGLVLGKAATATVGNVTAVSTGHSLGQIAWAATDGSTFNTTPIIFNPIVNGAVAAGIVPTDLRLFIMDSAGVSQERMRWMSTGLISFGGTSNAFPALKRSSTQLQFRLADDSAYCDAIVNELLVGGGTSTFQSAAASVAPFLQIVGTTFNTASAGAFEYSANNTAYGTFQFSKSRNATIGSHTIVQTGDFLGEIDFNGSDGNAAFRNAASITAEVDTGTPSTTSMPGRLVLWTTPDTSTTASRRMTITASGLVGIASTAPTSTLHVGGSFATSVPVVTTSTAYSVTSTDTSVVYNTTGTATTTLPTASSFVGRRLYVKTVTAQAVNSASSNVIPLASTVVGTTILSSTAGKWAHLHSDGSNWIVMAGN